MTSRQPAVQTYNSNAQLTSISDPVSSRALSIRYSDALCVTWLRQRAAARQPVWTGLPRRVENHLLLSGTEAASRPGLINATAIDLGTFRSASTDTRTPAIASPRPLLPNQPDPHLTDTGAAAGAVDGRCSGWVFAVRAVPPPSRGGPVLSAVAMTSP